ncbi:non-heme iron oxygenase ferredoxin subunit [bacterium]|nr:non-heme iron oxygenase ferredoxin subunit [bacterium]QQR56505.1 MAG: non-heme iron oxygenase ferredoxin subunit [Candidatus Melainabacteria bacterium]
MQESDRAQSPFQKVANASEIPEGEARIYPFDGGEVAICHTQGNYFALENMCSHARSPLESGPLANESQIKCPLHGARFDVKTGKAMCLPAVMPVKTYTLEQRGDELWLAKK